MVGEEAFLSPNLAPFQIPFGDWFFCALNGEEETEPPDKLALDCKHLRNLYPADEKEGRRERGKEGRGGNPQWLSPTAAQNPPESEKNGTKESGGRGGR